jgi:hypothetical protein
MDLQSILSISGKSGLFKLLSSSNATTIVESLNDKKRVPVHAANKVSSLDDISIYTYEEDKPLSEVFELIMEKEKGGPAIDPKSDGKALKAYMNELLPDYDEDRVYTSDLKKLFTWYNTLLRLDLLKADETEESEEKAEVKEVQTEESADESEAKSAE